MFVNIHFYQNNLNKKSKLKDINEEKICLIKLCTSYNDCKNEINFEKINDLFKGYEIKSKI
jgi:hypothetical protein